MGRCLLLVVVCCAVLSGCGSYSHARTAQSLSMDSCRPGESIVVGKIELRNAYCGAHTDGVRLVFNTHVDGASHNFLIDPAFTSLTDGHFGPRVVEAETYFAVVLPQGTYTHFGNYGFSWAEPGNVFCHEIVLGRRLVLDVPAAGNIYYVGTLLVQCNAIRSPLSPIGPTPPIDASHGPVIAPGTEDEGAYVESRVPIGGPFPCGYRYTLNAAVVDDREDALRTMIKRYGAVGDGIKTSLMHFERRGKQISGASE